MSKTDNTLSFRQSFEQAAALALYIATALVVAVGTVEMCARATLT